MVDAHVHLAPRLAFRFGWVRLLVCLWILATGAPAAAESEASEAGAHRGTFPMPTGVRDAQFNGDDRKWDLYYRYRRDWQEGSREGGKRVSTSEVLAEGWRATATQRDGQTHLFGVGFAPVPRLRLFAEVPYHQLTTEYESATARSTVTSEGVGDVQFGVMADFMRRGDEHLGIGLRVAAPSGSISQRGTIVGQRSVLPYPMQLGSGTWAMIPSLIYHARTERFVWGTQFMGTYQLAETSEDYRLGDRVELSFWVGTHWGDRLDLTLRLLWTHWSNVVDADPRMPRSDIPSADPQRQKGQVVDLGPGVSLKVPGLDGHRVSAEFLFPIYQWLDGPQVELDNRILVAWRWGF